MPKLPKQLRTSRGARVDPSPLKDLPEVSVASTFKPTVMNDDTEMEVDPPPITTALKRNKRESKKTIATQKPSISRAEGQRPKAYQQKILRKNMARNGDYPSGWPKVVPTLKFTKKGGTGYRKNKTSADTTKTDSKKVSKDIAELSNILQARFSVFDETMEVERASAEMQAQASVQDTAALIKSLRSTASDFQMSFDKDLEMLGAAVENDTLEHIGRMSHALTDFADKMRMEAKTTSLDVARTVTEKVVLLAGDVEDRHESDTLLPDLKHFLQNRG